MQGFQHLCTKVNLSAPFSLTFLTWPVCFRPTPISPDRYLQLQTGSSTPSSAGLQRLLAPCNPGGLPSPGPHLLRAPLGHRRSQRALSRRVLNKSNQVAPEQQGKAPRAASTLPPAELLPAPPRSGTGTGPDVGQTAGPGSALPTRKSEQGVSQVPGSFGSALAARKADRLTPGAISGPESERHRQGLTRRQCCLPPLSASFSPCRERVATETDSTRIRCLLWSESFPGK